MRGAPERFFVILFSVPAVSFFILCEQQMKCWACQECILRILATITVYRSFVVTFLIEDLGAEVGPIPTGLLGADILVLSRCVPGV